MSKILVDEIASKTGGTTGLTIDASGNVAASGHITNNNPCFHVKDSSTYTSGVLFTGNNLQIPINVGGHFSGSTGLFTAPFSGIFMFHVLTMANGGSYVRPHFVIIVLLYKSIEPMTETSEITCKRLLQSWSAWRQMIPLV